MNQTNSMDIGQMHIHNSDSGNKMTSDVVIPLKPNPSNRFTGRTEIIAKLKRHFSDTNDSAQKRQFFLLYEMGGYWKDSDLLEVC